MFGQASLCIFVCLPQPDGGNDRGWVRNRDVDSEGHRIVRLRRDTTDPEEGVFTCNIPEDSNNNNPASLGIYYPSESLHFAHEKS